MIEEPEQPDAQPEGEPQPEEGTAEETAAQPEQAEQASEQAEPVQEGSQEQSGEQPDDDAAEAASEAEAESAGDTAKAKTDLPPGAELDPIALEPERELSAEERARVEAEAEERARREAEATAEAPEEQPVATSRTPAELAAEARYMATGKRKRSIARVLITPGDGKFEINRRPLNEYFPRPLHQSTALQPLSVSGYEGTVDVRVNVKGGGIGGQAGAVRHGIARALTEIDPELRKELKRRGFLTRDARVKERRKAGLKKARKRPQFSKR
jgi:small subunit ribosomal protein S9